jgi:hypothetical protein
MGPGAHLVIMASAISSWYKYWPQLYHSPYVLLVRKAPTHLCQITIGTTATSAPASPSLDHYIGNNVHIGAGAVVTKDIPDGLCRGSARDMMKTL